MAVKIENLEKATALQILVYLYHQNKSVQKTQLDMNVNGQNIAVTTSLSVLEKLNLVKQEKDGNCPFVRAISLTEKGKNIARLLTEIEANLQ